MRVILALILSLITLPLWAQERNDFWILWERDLPVIGDCTGSDCIQSTYFGHYINGMDASSAQRFFHGLQNFASDPSHANIRLPHSALCLSGAENPVYPDASLLEKASKIEMLQGLSGVHIDLRAVRGPQSFKGSFGERAQVFMEKTFAAHGIQILAKEDAAKTTGNPVVTMRFSAEVHGCRPWSVSLSMSQRLLIARMPELMFEGTTWSTSARQDESNGDFGPEDAAEKVLVNFAQAWAEANDPKWVKPKSN